jgi:dTDP-4-amino-4,6-dideoxygalactose transaminase
MATDMKNSYDPIPLMAPLRAFEEQESEILDATRRVLKSGMWIFGPEGRAFEEEFAKFMGADRTVAVSTGTDALILSLQALGVGAGDEVITPAYSFFASASVIAHRGAKPVFVDVNESTFNVNPDAVEAAITPRTKGIVAVHLYGLPVDLPRLKQIADKHKIFLLEDACQAVGARVNGKTVGTFGDLAAFSFYPTKNLAACGEGGCVSGANAAALEVVSKLRVHGETQRYHHSMLGRNCRLDEMQSSILKLRLKKLPEWTQKRQKIAQMYTDAWADLPLRVPYVPDGFEHVFHLYVIKSLDREKLKDFLNQRKIGNGVYYPVILPGLEVFSGLGHKPGEFPVSEQLCREVLALPMFPHLTDNEANRVIEAVFDFHGQKS